MATATLNSAFRRNLLPRSERIESQPDRLKHFAKFSFKQSQGHELPAQYTNISATGMGIISRKSTPVRVGDYVKIKFNLPDTGETLTREGEVVRVSGEYLFAVEFTDLKEEAKESFAQRLQRYADFLGRPRWMDRWNKAKTFVQNNRLQVQLGAAALVLGVILSAYMVSYSYSHQDAINSWGKIPHVKELRWENFKKFISEAL